MAPDSERHGCAAPGLRVGYRPQLVLESIFKHGTQWICPVTASDHATWLCWEDLPPPLNETLDAGVLACLVKKGGTWLLVAAVRGQRRPKG